MRASRCPGPRMSQLSGVAPKEFSERLIHTLDIPGLESSKFSLPRNVLSGSGEYPASNGYPSSLPGGKAVGASSTIHHLVPTLRMSVAIAHHLFSWHR